MEAFLRRSRAANSVVSGLIGPKLELVQDYCISWLSASLKRIGSLVTEKKGKY